MRIEASRKPLLILGGVILVAALLGLGVTAAIVQKEGPEGLWKRKREFLEGIRPESKPVLDEAERQMKSKR